MATINEARNTLEHKLRKQLEDIELRRQRAAIRMRKDEMSLQMLLFKMTKQFGDYACLDTPEDVRAELKKGIRRSIMASKEDKENEKAIAAAAEVNDPHALNPVEAAKEADEDDPEAAEPVADETVEDRKSKTDSQTSRENRRRKRRRKAAAAASQLNRPERPSYKKLREQEDIDRAKLNQDSYAGLMSVYRPTEKEDRLINRWLDRIYPAGNNMSATICGLKKRMMRKEARDLVNQAKSVDTTNIKRSLSVNYFPEIVKYKPRVLKQKHKTNHQLIVTNSSDSSGYSSDTGAQTRRHFIRKVDMMEDDDLSDEARDLFPEDELQTPRKPSKKILKLPNIKGATKNETSGGETHQTKKVSIRSPEPDRNEISESNNDYKDGRSCFVTHYGDGGDQSHNSQLQSRQKNVLDEFRRQSANDNQQPKQSESVLDNQKPPLLPKSSILSPSPVTSQLESTVLDEIMNRRSSVVGSEVDRSIARRLSIVNSESVGRRSSVTDRESRRRQSSIDVDAVSTVRRRSSISTDTLSTARRASLTVHSSRRASVIINVDYVTGDDADEAALEKEWDEVKKCRYIRGYEPPEMRTPGGALVDYVFHRAGFEGDDEFETIRASSAEPQPEESPKDGVEERDE